MDDERWSCELLRKASCSLRNFAPRFCIEEAFTDAVPGKAVRVTQPARPENLQFAARKTAPVMPKAESLKDPKKRAIAHHVMANHELQALEVMAMVLLAFPDAPGISHGHGSGDV